MARQFGSFLHCAKSENGLIEWIYHSININKSISQRIVNLHLLQQSGERQKSQQLVTNSKMQDIFIKAQCLYFQFLSYIILVLAKKQMKVTNQEYESIINLGPDSAAAFLYRLYQKLTGLKLNLDRRLNSTITPVPQPFYAKPTASHIAKDRELHRVVNINQKLARTKNQIQKHKNDIHTQKYNTGLIQWLINKRKQQIQVEVRKQRQEIEKKTKIINTESKVQVREIELKCFNSSTSKKPKGEFGDFMDNKGVLQFLAQSCSLLLKKEQIVNDIKKLGLEIKEKQTNQSNNIIYEMFKRCEQIDLKGNRKLTPETIKKLIEQFKKTSEMNLIIENINGNFLDFKKFLGMFIKPLKIYDKDSETYKQIFDLLETIALGLHKVNSENAEMMFQEILLSDLVKIGENEFKKGSISQLCLSFVRKQSQSYFQLLQRIKQIYKKDMRMYISYLAQFIQIICKQCDNVLENLWNEFFFYGFSALNNMSPSVRVNGAKIISKLFTDLVVAGDDIITDKLTALKNLILDPWWEVKAQALIIFKSILVSKYKNQTNSESASLNDNLTMKTILHYILEIFKPNSSHNILRIGLIQLAQLLNYEESLCERYLQVLLHVGQQIRTDILTTSVIKYGPVVFGANTFSYKLTGAPLVWNSIGILKVLDKYITEEGISELSKPHLQIIYSSLIRASQIDKKEQWLNIYQSFKEKIFKSFLDDELCGVATSIIKQFLQIQSIHAEIIISSKTQISRVLSNISLDTGNSQAKDNLLSFFEYLKENEPQVTYKLLKQFAEREKTKYLSSNLVDFMNVLSRQRRKQIFNHE